MWATAKPMRPAIIAGAFALVLGLGACEGQTTAVTAEAARIQVLPGTATVSMGGTRVIEAVVEDAAGRLLVGRPVSWSSSNAQVVRVTTGSTSSEQLAANAVLTAIGPGEATVTATLGGTGLSSSSRITVVPPPVASVTVSPSSGSVAVGATLQLSATLRDAGGNLLTGRTVNWSSSNARASVSSSGVVTGVSTGTVTITATSEGRSGSATVTVTSGTGGSGTLGVGFGNEQFALIPVGSFQMGSTNGRTNEQPVHTVNITRAFQMQRTEVTQGQWREIMGSNPSEFSSCGDTCPVERVSWNDIQQFLTALNQRFPGRNYRLPTEAEWEYAARAGTTGDYGGTGVLDEMGWYRDNSGSRTHPVAGKQPNAWGLYDMHGNVFEWVQDWYSSSYYSVSPANDPPGPSSGSGRVLRGGSWFISAVGARSAYRFGTPSVRYSVFGFRLARTP